MNKLKILLPSLLLGLINLAVGISASGELIDISIGMFKVLIFNYFLLFPLFAIYFTILIKRKYLGYQPTRYSFYYALLPGIVFSCDFSWFLMDHSEGFYNYINFMLSVGYFMLIFFAVLSGLIGLLMNFIWGKIAASGARS